jgi:hypothetical protein
MTKQMILLTLTLFTITGCQSSDTLALVDAQTLQNEASSAPSEIEVASAGPAIDYNSRSATNYEGALAECQLESRNLCTKVQMADAFFEGKIDYSYGNPGDYWMVKTDVAPYRNNYFVALGAAPSFRLIDTEYTRRFYCCL